MTSNWILRPRLRLSPGNRLLQVAIGISKLHAVISPRLFRQSVLLSPLIFVAGIALLPAQNTKATISTIQSLIRSQQYEQAVQATEQELHRAPDDFRLWTLKGIALSLKGAKVDAISAFDKALRLSPEYTPAIKGEVELLYPAGDKRAIPLLERILKADPGDATAHEMLGVLDKHQSDCSGAVAQFTAVGSAIDTHPQSLEAYGYCLMQLKQYPEAIPVFEKLAVLLPDQTYPKYDLAVVQVTTKHHQEALKTLAPLIAANTRDPDVLSLASEANESLGKTPEAVSLLRQAIVLSPSTPDYYVSFAALCLDHDSFQTGITMLDAGLQRAPNNSALYLSRGLLYAQLAQYDKAEADFAKAEKFDAAQSLSSYALDLAEMQRNNPEQALQTLRRQLRAHPENPTLNFLLAKLLMNQTPAPESPAFKDAMRSASLVVKMKPEMADAHDLLATMYMSLNQYDRAIEQCRAALQYAPSNETATYHLVIALRHAGHKDELPALVKRLAELHQESLRKETERKRYRLEVSGVPPAS